MAAKRCSGEWVDTFEKSLFVYGVFDAMSAIELPAAIGHVADVQLFVGADGSEFFFIFFDEGGEPGAIFAEEEWVEGVQRLGNGVRGRRPPFAAGGPVLNLRLGA